MDWLKDNYAILLDNPFIRAGIIIIGSIVIAKVTDWIFVGFFRRWSSKTKTNLDDSIVNFLHKPIFYSILFFGFSTGVNLLGLPEFLNFAILGIFKTVTILIWLSLFVKVFTMSMEWTTKRTDNKILQSRTLPLFNNLGKIYPWYVYHNSKKWLHLTEMNKISVIILDLIKKSIKNYKNSRNKKNIFVLKY